MKVIYKAENSIDAHLLKGLLEQAGVVAFVNGQYLQGAMGELPATDLITVSVADEDVDQAMEVVARFQADLSKASGKGESRWDLTDQLLDWDG